MKEFGAASGRGKSISGAFVFLLLGVFALFSTMLVLLSAQLYRTTVDQTRLHNDRRVLGSYLMNIVRGNDAADAVRVERIGETEALCFAFDADGEEYVTYVYCWDGALRELFAPAEEPFAPEYGEEICPARSLRANLDGARLEMVCVDGEGQVQKLCAALRCADGGEGARP